MSDNNESPVQPHVIYNLLLAAQRLFADNHHAFADSLLVKAEELAPRISDPIQYLAVVNQLDKLWRTYHVETGLTKGGHMPWQQIDLPFGEN